MIYSLIKINVIIYLGVIKVKFKRKLLTILACVFLLTGCKVYIYDVGADTTDESTNSDNSSNLTQEGTGTTIVTDNVNYDGGIKYATTLPDGSKTWDSVYASVKDSVVTIRNIVNDKLSATGSGVFFSEDNITNGHSYIFTNAHVVEGATSIEVLLANSVLVQGEVVGYDKNEDVAVVQINKQKDCYKIATLRNSDTLRIGEEILAVGSPIGEKYSETATSGIISNLNIDIQPDGSSMSLYLIQIDAALNPGNSGGPLFDKDGNLIGINTIKLLSSGTTSNIESFNYSIPISHFALVANYLLQGSMYYRPYLSITITDVRYLTFNQREQYGVTINHGLLLQKIGQDSPLYSKTTTGKIITHIENIEVIKANDFSVELLKHSPNETITITVCDGDGSNSQEISVKLLKRTD